jgi:hypothetical protein
MVGLRTPSPPRFSMVGLTEHFSGETAVECQPKRRDEFMAQFCYVIKGVVCWTKLQGQNGCLSHPK